MRFQRMDLAQATLFSLFSLVVVVDFWLPQPPWVWLVLVLAGMVLVVGTIKQTWRFRRESADSNGIPPPTAERPLLKAAPFTRTLLLLACAMFGVVFLQSAVWGTLQVHRCEALCGSKGFASSSFMRDGGSWLRTKSGRCACFNDKRHEFSTERDPQLRQEFRL